MSTVESIPDANLDALKRAAAETAAESGENVAAS